MEYIYIYTRNTDTYIIAYYEHSLITIPITPATKANALPLNFNLDGCLSHAPHLPSMEGGAGGSPPRSSL